MACPACAQNGEFDDLVPQFNLTLKRYLAHPLKGATQADKKAALLADLTGLADVLLIQGLLGRKQLGLPAKNKSSVDHLLMVELAGLKSEVDKNIQSWQQRSLRALFEVIQKEYDGINLCSCVIDKADSEKIDVFKRDAESRLSPEIEIIKNKIPELKEIKFAASKGKSEKQLVIKVHFTFMPDPITKKFVGKNAITAALDFIRELSLPSFDVTELDSPAKVTEFIDREVRPTLEKFKDHHDVERIIVYTADTFEWSQRVMFKNVFRQKDRYLMDICLNSGEVIRNTLRGFKDTDKSFLRHMQPDTSRILRELMKITGGRLQAKIIQNVSIEFDDQKHSRVHAHVKYTDGSTDTINYFANSKRVDNQTPLLVINRNTNLHIAGKKATHLIFYLWSADEMVRGRRRILFKFGVTGLTISGGYSDKDIERAVQKRYRDYTKGHGLDTKNLTIELLSNVQPKVSRAGQALLDFENYLKNRENNKMLYISDAPNLSPYKSKPTELMFSDRDDNVVDYILELANNFDSSINLKEVLKMID